MKKTNAARLLDAKSIQYELAEYEVDESDLSATTLAKKFPRKIAYLWQYNFSNECKSFFECC